MKCKFEIKISNSSFVFFGSASFFVILNTIVTKSTQNMQKGMVINMENVYPIEICGLKRNLPICPVNDELSIAGFVMFSDVEITVATATELLKRVKERVGDFDVIITAESKGIPLAYEMSRQSGKKYIPARKSTKLYMKDPVAVPVKSITTTTTQTLYLDRVDMEYINGKKVYIVDDVISTGESLAALSELVRIAGGNVVAMGTVLAEGDAAKRDDIIFLEELPVFFKGKE